MWYEEQRQKLLVRFLLLAVGVIIFLVTNEPMAGAVLPSMNAGWRSVRTALWILRSDQRRGRARVCAAFCLATAFWQAAASALVSVILFGIVYHATGREPNLQRFAATMWMLAGGVVLTSIVGLAAGISAWILAIRVWVHPRLRELTNGDLEAAVDLSPQRCFNHAVFVIGTSLACPITCTFAFLLIEFRSGLFTGSMMIATYVLGVVSYWWLASRTVATHPAECWA